MVKSGQKKNWSGKMVWCIDSSRAVYRVSPNCSFPQISKWDSLTKFVVLLPESSKNLTFILKNSPNIQYLTWYLTQYSTWGQVTWPWSINFTIGLRLDLGHQILVFVLTTNLEKISILSSRLSPLFSPFWVNSL